MYHPNKLHDDDHMKSDKTSNQSFSIEGLAKIITGQRCDMRLTLYQVEQSETILPTKYLSSLEKYPIKFCLNNGKLQSFEYSWKDEISSVRIKRALLIQLQMSSQTYGLQFYTNEIDHLGSCQTQYIPKTINSQSVTMIKKRNSMFCKNEYEASSIIDNLASSDQKFTVNTRYLYLQSDLICELTYTPNGPMKNVNCEETSVTQQQWFPLFFIKTLTFKVNMHINLTEETVYGDEITKFNEISEVDSELPDENENQTLVIEKIITNQSYISMVLNSPEKFNDFIQNLKYLTYEQWKIVYDSWELNNQTDGMMKFYENVILEVQTEASLRFIINHFIVNAKNQSNQLKWINCLNVIKKPTIKLMKEIKNLLTSQLYNYTVYFVSLCIKQFCENNASCMEYQIINELVEIIENTVDLQDSIKSLRTLETIANIGPVLSSQKVISIIGKMLIDHKIQSDDNIRLYTAKIAGQLKCDQDLDKLLWSIFSTNTESNELRITIFHSYIQCLTEDKLKKILKVLNKSLDNQIRSYVIYKLVSLLKTQDPSKKHLQLKVRKYEYEIIQLSKDNGLLFAIRNSGYHEWIQKTKYGNFLTELSIIYESYSIIPNLVTMKLKYQNKETLINIIEVLYRYGYETFLYKVLMNLMKTFTSIYIPWMNDYAANIDNQTQTSSKYDSIFIKWFDQVVFHSSNLSYQLQNWFATTRQSWWNQPIETNHAKRLWESTDSYPLLSGFHIEWKINIISYLNFYMNNAYNLNPFKLALHIDHKSNLYISESILFVIGSHENFGFRSDQQIDLNFHINDSFKFTSETNDLSLELLFHPWSHNFELFKYMRSDYFVKNGRPYIEDSDLQSLESQQSTTTTTLKPFNWFHLNIGQLCDTGNVYSSVQVFRADVIEAKGFFLKFNYLSTNTEKNNKNSRIIMFIDRPSVSMQQNSEKKSNVFQFDLTINNEENILRHVDLKFSTYLEDSYHLQINITHDGLIQAIGCLNQQRILQANGSFEVHENNTNAVVQVYNPSSILNFSFQKYHNSFCMIQAISQADQFPFQFSLINDVTNQRNLKMLGLTAFHTSLHFNISDLLKILWSLHLNSTEDNISPSYYSKMLLDVTMFQDFITYQTSVFWNETLSNKTTINKDENDKNITIETKAQSSIYNHLNFGCTINIFKTKEFLIPLNGQPSEFYIYTRFLYPNEISLHEFSLTTRYEVDLNQLRRITTSATCFVDKEKIGFILNSELEWKLTDTGTINRLHSTNYIHSKPVNETIKLILLHDVDNQLLSLMLMEYNDQYCQRIYSVKNWLQPWRNLHEIAFQWPSLQSIQIVTVYDIIPLDSYSGVTLDHLVYYNQNKYITMKNQIMFKLDEQKLLVLHLTKRLITTITDQSTLISNNISRSESVISQFELIFQLYHDINLLPLRIKVIAENKINLLLPSFEISKNVVGKLKADLTKLKGDTVFELLTSEWNNQSNFGIQWNFNYEFNIKSVVNAIIAISTQPSIQNNIIFNWKASDNSQFLILNCMIPSVGNFIYHFKHRWESVYHFEGSNMISVQPLFPNRFFTGFYLNNNYALQFDSSRKLFEIRAEYTTTNSLGPGSPLRIRIIFKHTENYEHGNLEIGLDSQLIGYYLRYEMMNAMVEYELNSLSVDKQIELICRSIIGYRLYEGRGTRGYQSELFIIQNKNDYSLDILFKIGRPGLMHQNTIEYSHLLQCMQTKFRISTVYLGNPYFSAKMDLQYEKDLLLPIHSNISLVMPWQPFYLTIQESIQMNKSSSIINQSLLISVNKSTTFYYFNQTSIFENKLARSVLNIRKRIELEWNTNVLNSHFGRLSYKRLQNITSGQINEQLIGNWNSSIFLLLIQQHLNNHFNIQYNLTDKLWSNIIDGQFSMINETKQEYIMHKYNYNGNFKTALHQIDFKLKNMTMIFEKKGNNYTINDYVELSYCKEQKTDYVYSIEHMFNQQPNSDFYQFYSRINKKNRNIFSVDLQFENFDNVYFSVKIVPIDFIKVELIDIQMKNSVSPGNFYWVLNGSLEIQPCLPKILVVIKILPAISDLKDNGFIVRYKPFQCLIVLKNTDKESKWKIFDMAYIQSYNESGVQVSNLSVELSTPFITLPYTTVAQSNSIQYMTSHQSFHSQIKLNTTENSLKSIHIKMTLLQMKNNLSILINIHEKYKILLEIKRTLTKLLKSPFIHSMNLSIFDQQKELGKFLQIIEIVEMKQQLCYKLKNYLHIIDYNIYNVSVNLIHSNKQTNNSFALFTFNYNSTVPLLIEQGLNEINFHWENRRDKLNLSTMCYCSLQRVKIIHYKLQIATTTTIRSKLFLKLEMHLNNFIGFKQNHDWLIKVHIIERTNYSLVFSCNNKKISFTTTYDVLQSVLIVNIKNSLYFRTNLLKFISTLLHFTENLIYQQQNTHQMTAQPLLINDENSSIEFILVTSNFINLTFEFQTHNDARSTQIQQIPSTNLDSSSNLLYIPFTHCLVSTKQNISIRQLVADLNDCGSHRNSLYNYDEQSNLTSQTSTTNHQNKIIIIKSSIQIYNTIAFNSNVLIELNSVNGKISPCTINVTVNKITAALKNIHIQVFTKYHSLNQGSFLSTFNVNDGHRLMNLTISNNSLKNQVIILLNTKMSNNNSGISIEYMSENQKKSVVVKTSCLRELTYSYESSHSIIDEKNIYKNKTFLFKSVNSTNSKWKKATNIEFTVYQNYVLDIVDKGDIFIERLLYTGFYLKTNILKQDSINILSKISTYPENTQLVITLNHGFKSVADHQIVVTWPHVFEEKQYPLLFLKTVNNTLNLTGGCFQQPGLFNASMLIITNGHHTHCKFHWKKWSSIYLFIENHLELMYNLIYRSNHNNIYHNNYDYDEIFQVIYQLYNQDNLFNFNYLISINYPDKNRIVNNDDIFAIQSVIGSNKHKTILQIKSTENYGAMLQVTSHQQSINQSRLDGRLMVNIDHSNILHLLSYWRPEISEDLLVSVNELPKQFSSLVHLSFSKTYQYGQKIVTVFTDNLISSVDEIQFYQLIDTAFHDLEYIRQILTYWIDKKYLFIELLNMTTIGNMLQVNVNITKINLWEKLQELNIIAGKSQFNIVKYLNNTYENFTVQMESNTQNNSFQQLINSINPLINHILNITMQRSNDFAKDAIKGLKISVGAFDAFWYSTVETYNIIWIKMPTNISESIYNLLVNHKENSKQIGNITVFLKQANEYLKITNNWVESIRINFSRIGLCTGEKIREQRSNEIPKYRSINQFVQLIREKQVEELYGILFKPHMSNFTKSTDKSQYYFEIYIPHLIKLITYFVPKIWPYYIQILEEQSKMKSQINHLTTEASNALEANQPFI
ncbi:unnamed protein product [Schistosoma turkestanicum]|nr:unnamed protein product [Schistosoma turkestanicum]